MNCSSCSRPSTLRGVYMFVFERTLLSDWINGYIGLRQTLHLRQIRNLIIFLATQENKNKNIFGNVMRIIHCYSWCNCSTIAKSDSEIRSHSYRNEFEFYLSAFAFSLVLVLLLQMIFNGIYFPCYAVKSEFVAATATWSTYTCKMAASHWMLPCDHFPHLSHGVFPSSVPVYICPFASFEMQTIPFSIEWIECISSSQCSICHRWAERKPKTNDNECLVQSIYKRGSDTQQLQKTYRLHCVRYVNAFTWIVFIFHATALSKSVLSRVCI